MFYLVHGYRLDISVTELVFSKDHCRFIFCLGFEFIFSVAYLLAKVSALFLSGFGEILSLFLFRSKPFY